MIIKKEKLILIFKDFYYEELSKLGVVRVVREDIKNFKKHVLSGSQYVRSTLAFFITFLRLKKKHNINNFVFPLIIDSPFEGDQDSHDRNAIIDSLMNFVTDEQVIIGMRDAKEYFVKYGNVNFIELNNDKGNVLLSSEFEENKEHNHAIAALIINL